MFKHGQEQAWPLRRCAACRPRCEHLMDLPEGGHGALLSPLPPVMDGLLADALATRGQSGYAPPAAVRQCETIAESKEADTPRQAAFRHWLAVGSCVPADFLLVPQLISFRERNLPEEQPASVTMDFFLLDVKNQRVARRFRFDETQQPLLSNLFDVDKFVARGGKWISGEELAREGLAQAVKELGL